MSAYNDIRTALGNACQSYESELNVFHYVPRTIIPPAAIIRPAPHRTISYLQTQSSFLAEWHFSVLIVIGEVSEEDAQDRAGVLISPGSALIRTLNECLTYVQVTDGAVSEMSFGQGLYTYAQLSVVVKA